MTNEAIIVELLGNKGDPIRYTCADGTGIAKGALLVLQSPRAVIAHAAVDTPFVGIAASEKKALDGETSIAAYTNGIFILKVKTGGTAATIGDGVSLSSELNAVELENVNFLDGESNFKVGTAIENIAHSTSGLVRIRL